MIVQLACLSVRCLPRVHAQTPQMAVALLSRTVGKQILEAGMAALPMRGRLTAGLKMRARRMRHGQTQVHLTLLA